MYDELGRSNPRLRRDLWADIKMAEHFQSGVNLTKARVGYVFLPSSAKDFVPEGVVLRAPNLSIGPLDTFALWSRGNVDPLVHRVLSLLKEIKREL
jgi:hypothetical protein